MTRGSPKSRSIPIVPTFDVELSLHARGYQLVAGVDEVGRGALAGPVVASAVILPPGADFPWLANVKDSKQLTPSWRERLYPLICQGALAVGTGMVASEVIDMIGILAATKDAMRQAIRQLARRPHFVLIDYVTIPRLGIPHKGVTNGDESSMSIACASIVAKVTRDNLMRRLDGELPGYGFAKHKGYGTAEHLGCLRKLGPSRIHRLSWEIVRDPRSAAARRLAEAGQ